MNLIPWRGKRQEEQDVFSWPGSALSTFRTEMDRLIDRFMPGFHDDMFGLGSSGFWPNLDVAENDAEVTIRAEVPGVDPKDIEITLSGQTLTLSGEKKEVSEKKGENYFHSERRFGSFRRSIQLPVGVNAEQITAEHKNGVIMIRLQKLPGAVARKIPVSSS